MIGHSHPKQPLPNGRSSFLDRFLPPVTLRVAGIGYLLIFIISALFFGKYAFSAGHRTGIEVFVWLTIPPLVWLYLCGMRSVQQTKKPQTGLIVFFAFLSGLAAVAIVPFNSTDIYAYTNAGWLQAHYGMNPYASVVRDIPGWQQDPVFSPYYDNKPFMYGFVFAWICKCLAQAGGGSLFQTLLVLKIMNFAAYGMCGLLLYAGAKKLELRRPDLSLYLFLWNPLLLLHAIGNGHNDILTILFLEIAFYLIIADRWFWVATALMCSILIKFMTLILVPFILLYCARTRRLRMAFIGLLPVALIFWKICLPYLAGFSHFRLGGIAGQFSDTTACLYQTITELYVMAAHLFHLPPTWNTPFNTGVNLALISAFGVVYGICFFQAVRTPGFSFEKLTSVSLMLSSLMLCAASATFYPWYVITLLPLALWLERGHWMRVFVIVLTCFQMFSFTAVVQTHILNYLLMVVVPVVWVAGRYQLFSGFKPYALIDWSADGREEKGGVQLQW